MTARSVRSSRRSPPYCVVLEKEGDELTAFSIKSSSVARSDTPHGWHDGAAGCRLMLGDSAPLEQKRRAGLLSSSFSSAESCAEVIPGSSDMSTRRIRIARKSSIKARYVSRAESCSARSSDCC